MENRDNQNRHATSARPSKAQQPAAAEQLSQQPETGPASGRTRPVRRSRPKAEPQQQPAGQSQQRPRLRSPSRQPTGQADYGSAGQSDTLTGERSDGETAQGSDIERRGEPTVEGGFRRHRGATDTSSELIEDDRPTSRKDGQGAPE